MTPHIPGSPESPADPLLPLFLRILRDRKRITFVLVDDLGDHCALTNLEEGVVFLDGKCSDGEARATLAHEMVHLDCSECPEDEVEAMTAELLVPLSEALAARARGDVAATAERLMVDAALVRARLRAADAAEQPGAAS